MTLFPRTLLIALAAVALATACGPTPPKADGGTGGDGGAKGCFDDSECPNAQLFFCNTTTSTCEPSCRSKADCSAAVRGQYALMYCASGLGCECDEGKCVGSLCSADVDCGGQVCRSGVCVDAPLASTVATCAVIPDYVVLKQGEKTKFWVSAWDSAKVPVVVKTGITWTAASGSVVVGTMTGNSASLPTPVWPDASGPESGSTTV